VPKLKISRHLGFLARRCVHACEWECVSHTERSQEGAQWREVGGSRPPPTGEGSEVERTGIEPVTSGLQS
jgi:hypothetical protein